MATKRSTFKTCKSTPERVMCNVPAELDNGKMQNIIHRHHCHARHSSLVIRFASACLRLFTEQLAYRHRQSSVSQHRHHRQLAYRQSSSSQLASFIHRHTGHRHFDIIHVITPRDVDASPDSDVLHVRK